MWKILVLARLPTWSGSRPINHILESLYTRNSYQCTVLKVSYLKELILTAQLVIMSEISGELDTVIFTATEQT